MSLYLLLAAVLGPIALVTIAHDDKRMFRRRLRIGMALLSVLAVAMIGGSQIDVKRLIEAYRAYADPRPVIDVASMATRCGRLIDRMSDTGNPNAATSYKVRLDADSGHWRLWWSVPNSRPTGMQVVACSGDAGGIRRIEVDGAVRMEVAARP